VGIYVECNNMTKHVISIMAKATAEESGFEYHDKDLNRGGLHNLVDLTATDLILNEIPNGMDSSDNATTPVLVLLPTTCPIGYGCPVPSRKLNKDEAKAALQEACHDRIFAWSNSSIDHLCSKYNGKSLHTQIADPTKFVDTYIVDTKKILWKTNLISNIWTITKTMDIDDEEYITLKENIEYQAFDQLKCYISVNDDTRTAFERSPANTPGSTTSSDMSTAIASAFSAVSSVAGDISAPDPTTKKFNIALMKLLCVYKDPQENWAIPKLQV
jgi:hypothetical protein